MKIIDRNGRLFGKISVIDLLVIAVVAVMAVALYVKTNQKEITSTTTQNTLAGVDGVEQVQLLVEGAALGQPLSPDQSLAAPDQSP